MFGNLKSHCGQSVAIHLTFSGMKKLKNKFFALIKTSVNHNYKRIMCICAKIYFFGFNNNMQISFSQRLNFTAKRQDYESAFINRLADESRSYEPYKAHVAEIDFNSSSDLKALDDLRESWADGHFIEDIFIDAKKLHNRKWRNDGTKKIFVLTAQNDNFEELEPHKVLSICELSGIYGKGAEVSYIETNPEYRCKSSAKYKRNGKALMEFLQSQFDKLTLNAIDEDYIHNFYKSLGFKLIEPRSGLFKWVK